MINHARTLLLNSRAASLTGPVTEYVPPAFAPVALSGSLHAVYQTLFGTQPTATTLELRARQYLALWHSSRFADQALVWDTRITYDPVEDITAAFVTITDATAALGGANPSGILFPTTYFPLPFFEVNGALDVSVEARSDVRIFLAAPNLDMQGGADCAQTLYALQQVPGAELAVFGTEQTEPWLACRNVWTTPTAPVADRWGAFLTAYVRRLEALRT